MGSIPSCREGIYILKHFTVLKLSILRFQSPPVIAHLYRFYRKIISSSAPVFPGVKYFWAFLFKTFLQSLPCAVAGTTPALCFSAQPVLLVASGAPQGFSSENVALPAQFQHIWLLEPYLMGAIGSHHRLSGSCHKLQSRDRIVGRDLIFFLCRSRSTAPWVWCGRKGIGGIRL